MTYTVKTFNGDEEQIRKFEHLIETAVNIVDEYFLDSYQDIVRSKSYSTQQIAAAYIYLGYYALRQTGPVERTSDLFDLIAHCAKEQTEALIGKTGKDPFIKRMT